jgi:hypothetical protein
VHGANIQILRCWRLQGFGHLRHIDVAFFGRSWIAAANEEDWFYKGTP